MSKETTDRQKVERTCAHVPCGVNFDAATDYAGHAHAPVRKYHSLACAAAARNAIRREQAAHERQYTALEELHQLEAGGQLSLVDEALPPVPARPSRKTA